MTKANRYPIRSKQTGANCAVKNAKFAGDYNKAKTAAEIQAKFAAKDADFVAKLAYFEAKEADLVAKLAYSEAKVAEYIAKWTNLELRRDEEKMPLWTQRDREAQEQELKEIEEALAHTKEARDHTKEAWAHTKKAHIEALQILNGLGNEEKIRSIEEKKHTNEEKIRKAHKIRRLTELKLAMLRGGCFEQQLEEYFAL
mmetsp:Transcript_13246/g.36582  ORF Transcript_13246/g.36582 Transcript_13246/m.36582 type:complete len:199 (-) Transcript_13246:75-671(-)